MLVRKQQVKTLYGTTDWFKIEKGVQQGCLLSSCLIYTQSTSGKMMGWMVYKLESRLLGEISATSDMWLSQCSRSGMPDSLEPRGLQPARLPCLSPTPRPCSTQVR